MPKFIYLIGLGLAAVGLAFGLLDCVMGPSPGVTEANSRRIQQGMTLKEVQAILGSSGQWCAKGGGLCGGVVIQHSLFTWKGTHGTAFVSFSSLGDDVPQVVNGVNFQRAAGPGPFARLQAWLGL
jgi:hypothetical protein